MIDRQVALNLSFFFVSLFGLSYVGPPHEAHRHRVLAHELLVRQLLLSDLVEVRLDHLQQLRDARAVDAADRERLAETWVDSSFIGLV